VLGYGCFAGECISTMKEQARKETRLLMQHSFVGTHKKGIKVVMKLRKG
jgi:hypothetical protein